MKDFVTIDVETANANLASICQIGLVHWVDNTPLSEYSILVNPEDYFSSVNIGIHSITKDKVKGSPAFPEVYDDLKKMLSQRKVFSHTHFDKASFYRACEKYEKDNIDCEWLDSSIVARRTWDEVSKKGYGLNNVCKLIGYHFRHHDALEDAKACGYVIIAAEEKTGLSAEDIILKKPNYRRIRDNQLSKIQVNQDGIFLNETIVFTGALKIPRVKAAEVAASMGCNVSNTVNKKTSLLVVGDIDARVTKDEEKTSKMIKAEELILAGVNIRIIGETDFFSMFGDCEA